jgi:hypothetical protein
VRPFYSEVDNMKKLERRRPTARRGLSTAVSMLFIIFSLTIVSTIAYSYALNRMGNRKEDLKLYAAEEKMLDMEEAISDVAWSPGSVRTLAFSDYGGQLRTEPSTNHLLINVTMDGSTYTIFDEDTGQIIYELPSTVIGRYGVWIRGDDRSIVNQSASYQAQMNVDIGEEHEELITRYRPLLSSSTGDLVSDRRINNIRIYIINLNSSETIESGGEFHVKAVGDSVTTTVHSYDLDASVTEIEIKAVLKGTQGTIEVPLTTSPSGSTVKIEVVICIVKIEEVNV